MYKENNLKQQNTNVAYLLADYDYRKEGSTFYFQYHGKRTEIENMCESFKDTPKKIYTVTIRQYDDTIFNSDKPSKVKKQTHHKTLTAEMILHLLGINFK